LRPLASCRIWRATELAGNVILLEVDKSLDNAEQVAIASVDIASVDIASVDTGLPDTAPEQFLP